MFRRVIAVVLLLSWALMQAGCYRYDRIPIQHREPGKSYLISHYVKKNGETVYFAGTKYMNEGAKAAWGVIRGNTISGWIQEDMRFRKIEEPLENVQTIYVRRIDALGTTLAVFGVGAALTAIGIGIFLATKESCPFVYSFNGEYYVFDGEPYGGAICPAFKRTDFCRLDSLREVDGLYRLQLTNEVNETQHTDEFTLWVVDHTADVRIVPDAAGNLYSLRKTQSLIHAVDQQGRDQTKWLSDVDPLWWESDIAAKKTNRPEDLRDTLYLSFPRPGQVSAAKLLVHAGTTLWGSQMLKRWEELWGDQRFQWCESMKDSTHRAVQDAWGRREEILRMRISVWADGRWSDRGEMLGGGPFITEDRVVPIDLSGVDGDSLRIRITPPACFWMLNAFAVDYSSDSDYILRELAADSATAHDGTDIRAALIGTDGIYYSAPDVGMRAYLTFTAPQVQSGLSRTVFAKVSGYYDIHHDSTTVMDADLLRRIADVPGTFAKFALEEYARWHGEQTATAPR